MGNGISVITIQVAVVDGAAFIVDENGKRLTNRVNVSKIKKRIREKQIEKIAWRSACSQMAGNAYCKSIITKKPDDQWLRKITTMARTLQIRSRYQQVYKNKRFLHDDFLTKTWEDAIKRMWKQGDANLRYQTAEPWEKWVRTVAKNHNRKSEHRESKFKTKDSNRKPDNENSGSPELQMLIEWASA